MSPYCDINHEVVYTINQDALAFFLNTVLIGYFERYAVFPFAYIVVLTVPSTLR